MARILESFPEEKQTFARTVGKTARGLIARERWTNGNTDEASKHEEVIKRLESVIEKADGGMWMLIYDIPTEKNEDCPNPSSLLWAYGFRLNLSCWVLPTQSLRSGQVQSLLGWWEANRIETHLIPYAKEAIEQIKKIAQTKIEERITAIRTSLLERILNATDRLNEMRGELDAIRPDVNEYVRAEQTAEANYRGTIRMAETGFLAVQECARLFEEIDNVSELLKLLRKTIEAEKQGLEAFRKLRLRI